MRRIRFLMLGGFLGAGKTTAIARVARHFMGLDLQVGVVTNDQAQGLVDTQSLRQQGFRVGEVPGACFCCKFDELVDVVGDLAADQRPDVILAEPVGSCTDLVATVIEPLAQLCGDTYDVGPLTVLLKPEHGQKILRNDANAGFSPKAAYIFLKQLEEADIVAINKIDKLSQAARLELLSMVKARFCDKQVFDVSAREGTGFGELLEAMARTRPKSIASLPIDYDVYAEGEAELGWLNCRVTLDNASTEFSLDSAVVTFVDRLRQRWQELALEPAHLKVLASTNTTWCVANVVSSKNAAELSHASQAHVCSAEFVINARIAGDPDVLASTVEAEIGHIAAMFGAAFAIDAMQSFRPGRPVPTHRFTRSS